VYKYLCYLYTAATPRHRNQTISRKEANIISRRPSHGHLARRCCPRIFSEVTYIRTVGNSSLLKIYTLPNHTINIGVCILETQLLGLLYGGGASFVQKWYMPWISANIYCRALFYIVWFLCSPRAKPLFVISENCGPFFCCKNCSPTQHNPRIRDGKKLIMEPEKKKG
jgi:hypothetical protein